MSFRVYLYIYTCRAICMVETERQVAEAQVHRDNQRRRLYNLYLLLTPRDLNVTHM